MLALVTLALVSVPFAHRAGAAPVTSQMTQFLAMGGNISDICGETGGHVSGGCESCRIVGAMLLPTPAQTSQAVSFQTILLDGANELAHPNCAVHYAHPPVRGPPRN